MTERVREQREPAREAIRDGSRHPGGFTALFPAAAPLAIGVFGVGSAAALLMVLVDFLPVVSVDVASGSCEVINDSSPELADLCEQSGFERHGPALLLLGLLSLPLALAAGLGGSRPAALALTGVGVVVLGIALLADLPVTDDTGAIGPRFEGARAQAEIGFTLELVAGALAVAAGALRLWLPARE